MRNQFLEKIQRVLVRSVYSSEDQNEFLYSLQSLEYEDLQFLAETFEKLPKLAPAVINFYKLKKLALNRHDPMLWHQVLREEEEFLGTFSLPINQ